MKDRLEIVKTKFDGYAISQICLKAGYSHGAQMLRDIERLIGKYGVPRIFEKKVEAGQFSTAYRTNSKSSDKFRDAVKRGNYVKAAVITQAIEWLELGNDLEDLDFPRRKKR